MAAHGINQILSLLSHEDQSISKLGLGVLKGSYDEATGTELKPWRAREPRDQQQQANTKRIEVKSKLRGSRAQQGGRETK